MFKRIQKKIDKTTVKKVVNKKVRNATKCVFNDIKFDSRLELYFYKLCFEKGIKIEREPKFILQSRFEYQGEKIREITMLPDFFLPDFNIIVEVKGGMVNDVFPIKRKMLLHHLHLVGKKEQYIMLRNQKEMTLFVEELLKK